MLVVFAYMLMLVGWVFVCAAVDGRAVREILAFVGGTGVVLFLIGAAAMRHDDRESKPKIVGWMMILTGLASGCWWLLGMIAAPHGSASIFAGQFVLATAYGFCGTWILREYKDGTSGDRR